jgi:hypothetical protein
MTTTIANNPNITKEAIAQYLGIQVSQIHSIRVWWRVVLVHGKGFCRFVSKKLFQQPEVKNMETKTEERTIRMTLDGKRGSWYKTVTDVNRSKGSNGYALEGDFVKQGKQKEFSPWDVIIKAEPVRRRGSYLKLYYVTYAQWLDDSDYWSRAYDRGDFLDFLDLVESYLDSAKESSKDSSEESEKEGKTPQECWENAQRRVLDANALAESIRAQGGQVSNEQVLEALHQLGIG